MARNDIHANPDGAGYLLDVQADLLDQLATRVVVPLVPLVSAPPPAQRLNPVFDIEGEPHAMLTQFLAAVPVGILGAPVATLDPDVTAITGALDMLFQGI